MRQHLQIIQPLDSLANAFPARHEQGTDTGSSADSSVSNGGMNGSSGSIEASQVPLFESEVPVRSHYSEGY